MIKEIITLDDLITASGTYPERRNSPELTDEVKANLIILKDRVNAMLVDLGITDAIVSSGFRPSSVNSAINNAAKLSAHMTGEACDLLDNSNQNLAKTVTKSVLEKHDLYREDYDFTKGKVTNWCHVQTRKTRSGNRIFKP